MAIIRTIFRLLLGTGPAPKSRRRPYAEVRGEEYSRETFQAEFVEPLRAALAEIRASVKRGKRLAADQNAGRLVAAKEIDDLDTALVAAEVMAQRLDGFSIDLMFASESSYGPFDRLTESISEEVDELKWIIAELREYPD